MFSIQKRAATHEAIQHEKHCCKQQTARCARCTTNLSLEIFSHRSNIKSRNRNLFLFCCCCRFVWKTSTCIHAYIHTYYDYYSRTMVGTTDSRTEQTRDNESNPTVEQPSTSTQSGGWQASGDCYQVLLGQIVLYRFPCRMNDSDPCSGKAHQLWRVCFYRRGNRRNTQITAVPPSAQGPWLPISQLLQPIKMSQSVFREGGGGHGVAAMFT